MTTQESEVDVLAVMDESVAAIEVGEYPGTALALADARAAVAEVFEAVRPIADLAELFDDELRGGNMPKADSDPIMQWPRLHKEYELKVGHLRNLRTALRNAGVKV